MKKWKNSPANMQKLYSLSIFSFFIQLYIAKVRIGSGSGENFLTKKVQIQPDPDQQTLVGKVLYSKMATAKPF